MKASDSTQRTERCLTTLATITTIGVVLVGMGIVLFGGEQLTADEKPATKTNQKQKTPAPASPKTLINFREAALLQVKSLVKTLKEKTRRLNDFKRSGSDVEQVSSSIVALARAIVESKDPVFVNDIPRFERIAANCSIIRKQTRRKTRTDWLLVKDLVIELESLLAAKHQDIERINQGTKREIAQAVREGTMKQFEAWFRSSREIKDAATMKTLAIKAERSARVVDLLSQSLATWDDADPDFENHANELQLAFAKVAKAAHQKDVNSYRTALTAASKKCAECHSEYRN